MCWNFFCFFSPQNLNKQAYDLAKALLKRTAQAIEPYITNVSEDCKQIWKSINFLTELYYKKNELYIVKWDCKITFYKFSVVFLENCY